MNIENGSSPRVRGTGMNQNPKPMECRFIPACAGNRERAGMFAVPNSVHPRVCGEQYLMAPKKLLQCGSSPRVRGTAVMERGWKADHRFIPACAGNRCDLYANTLHGPVHPRVCGEQSRRPSAPRGNPGSSPRVRGTV